MCGIVGYIGKRQAVSLLIDGLTKLEYRGYDSAGIAVCDHEKIHIIKSVGRLGALKEKLVGHEPQGLMGIGHTRWATHGRPSDCNAHPHMDCKENFVIVHNGIIENYLPIKERLEKKGHIFQSETDTEVIAHLMEEFYQGGFEATVHKILKCIEGAYSLVFMSRRDPDRLICTKKDNPLVIGLGDDENFIASDIPAIISHTRHTYIMNDGEIAIVKKDAVFITNSEGQPIKKEIFEVTWNIAAAEKGGYKHFMLKEIYEQPKVVRESILMHIAKDNSAIVMKKLNWDNEFLEMFQNIYIVACGTAYHAGLVGKYYIETLVHIPVEVDLASEFRYRTPIIDKQTLVIVISQSGETSDTLAALKEAKRFGARTLAVVNVVGSSIARQADQAVYTFAGPEIAVASTKAYTTQLIMMFMLSIYMADIKNMMTPERRMELLVMLRQIPQQMSETFQAVDFIQTLARKYRFSEDVFFIGRSLDYHVALEGALKLKEISYIHAEAYAAGELKHGALALITQGVPVVALVTQQRVYEKILNNIKEVKSRDAVVIAIASRDDVEIEKSTDHVIRISVTDELLMPILAVVPLQLLAYYAAAARGCDIDKPRNLAKSVTVE